MPFKYCVDCFITIRKWSGGEGIRDYKYLGCNVTQCYRHFRGKVPPLSTLQMEAACSAETTVNF